MSEKIENMELETKLFEVIDDAIDNFLEETDQTCSTDTLVNAHGIALSNVFFHVSENYEQYVMMTKRMIVILTESALCSQTKYEEVKNMITSRESAKE